ncbi:polysaccharide deacetylase family protein [Olivibacter sp. CPCC 100613]|uniref:polysaccharide deacetylase family protein n=1 Tax=Olivibacter sp. CPCC 100613 TaxID=3079931 RepID=UPI002FFAF6A6
MILLSFDIEEFDMPFEYGRDITFEDQIAISVTGSNKILDLLAEHSIRATFFSTVVFAQHAAQVIKRIIDEGHELASHGYYHTSFDNTHLALSKTELEYLSGKSINGYRMARMQPVEESAIEKAGYKYNSSINPTWLPGRYNNLNKPRACFRQGSVWQIPASVSPLLRFPLFWLAFHNLPLGLYYFLAKRTIRKDKYLNVYFHPWEFTDLDDYKRFGFPGYVRKNTGDLMIRRMNDFVNRLLKDNFSFGTFSEFVNTLPSGNL